MIISIAPIAHCDLAHRHFDLIHRHVHPSHHHFRNRLLFCECWKELSVVAYQLTLHLKNYTMKKLIVLAVALLSVATMANAQRIGVKAGANLNKVSGQAFKDGFDLGYHLGVFAEIDLNKKWGIQPELLFNQVNTKPSSASFDSVLNGWQNNTSSIKLNYLTIPILLRYNVNSMFSLNAGPQFGILLNKDQSLWANSKEAFKSGDFAMVLGAQVNLKLARVYARYNIGLSNINDINNSDSWKSQQIQLGVGIRL